MWVRLKYNLQKFSWYIVLVHTWRKWPNNLIWSIQYLSLVIWRNWSIWTTCCSPRTSRASTFDWQSVKNSHIDSFIIMKWDLMPNGTVNCKERWSKALTHRQTPDTTSTQDINIFKKWIDWVWSCVSVSCWCWTPPHVRHQTSLASNNKLLLTFDYQPPLLCHQHWHQELPPW